MNTMTRTQRLARVAVVAALYVVLTVSLPVLSYGAIQFRFAEILVLLCLYRKDYCYSLIVGCFIANIFSTLGYIDMIFGTASTIFSVVTMRYIKNIYVASLMPTISMVFIATELYLFVSEPFWLSLATTMLGEFVVVSILGVIIFKVLERNKFFMKLIGAESKSKRKCIEPPTNNDDYDNVS